jgi:hypothetical protein
MYCGSNISVTEAVAAIGLPNVQNILQTAITFLESGNLSESDNQLTRVLEYEPENRTAWLCKAMIASSPSLEIKFFGSPEFLQLQPYISQARTYFGKAMAEAGVEELFRGKAAAMLMQIAVLRFRGGDGARRVDSAFGMFEAGNEMTDDTHRQNFYRSGYCWMTLAILCLESAYRLSPSKAVVEQIRDFQVVLHHYPVAFPEWDATGRPLLDDLTQRIKREHPDWAMEQEKAVRAQEEGAKAQEEKNKQAARGCLTLIIVCVVVLILIGMFADSCGQ